MNTFNNLYEYLKGAFMNTCQNLREAASRGNLTQVQRLLPSSTNFEQWQALCDAASHGHAHCLEYLLSQIEFKKNERHSIFVSAMEGHHLNCVEYLISVSDNNDYRSYVTLAATGGFVECLNFLIEHDFYKHDYSRALWMTAKVGQVECVKALLPVADATIEYSRALREAAVRCDVECMEVLYAHSDPLTALEVLHIRAPYSTDSHALLENMIVQKQRESLQEATSEQGCLGHSRKI